MSKAIWIDLPGASKNGSGRYFYTAKDYKQTIIDGRVIMRARRSRTHRYITRNMSDHEKETMMPFIEKYLCFKKDNYCTIGDLYPTYKKMCDEMDLRPLTPATFGSCIRGHVILMEEIPGVLISNPCHAFYTNGYYNLGIKD